MNKKVVQHISLINSRSEPKIMMIMKMSDMQHESFAASLAEKALKLSAKATINSKRCNSYIFGHDCNFATSPWPTPIADTGLNILPELPISESNLVSKNDDLVDSIIVTFYNESKRKLTEDAVLSSDHFPVKKQRSNDFKGQHALRPSFSNTVVSSESFSSRESRLTVNFRSYQNDMWKKRFEELRDFVSENGHCVVPHSLKENRSLSKWVKRQRYQFRLKKEGKHSTLSDAREMALKGLGFIWDSHGAIWEERLEELKAFKQMHGHCNVPSTYQENHSLSIWVQCQRRQYKLWSRKKGFIDRKGPGMNAYRVAKLEKVGFVWDPRKSMS